MLSGTSPWTRIASQFTKPTTNAAMPRSDHPDEEREREEEPEEHGEPGALEVVAHDEADRSVLSARHGRILPHGATGVALSSIDAALTSLLQS